MTREEREEAIKELSAEYLGDSEKIINAKKLAIEALKAEACANAVDREAVLKAFEELPHEYKTKEQRARTGGIAACQTIVRELPPVTPAISEEAAAAFCDHYCRFPREYDEDLHGVPLAESRICLNCPINGGETGGRK